MAEKNEYFTQKLENGTLQISEDVVASVAAAAVLEVEGVCGLSSSISTDIAEMLGMKTLARLWRSIWSYVSPCCSFFRSSKKETLYASKGFAFWLIFSVPSAWRCRRC